MDKENSDNQSKVAQFMVAQMLSRGTVPERKGQGPGTDLKVSSP